MVAQVDVRRPTDDLQRAVSRVDDDEADSVRAFDRTNLIDPGHDHVLEPFPDVVNALDDQAEVVENRAEFVGRLGEFDELAQPRQ